MATTIFDTSGEAYLVTKKDLIIGLAPIHADLTLVKWMLGILLGGVVARPGAEDLFSVIALDNTKLGLPHYRRFGQIALDSSYLSPFPASS